MSLYCMCTGCVLPFSHASPPAALITSRTHKQLVGRPILRRFMPPSKKHQSPTDYLIIERTAPPQASVADRLLVLNIGVYFINVDNCILIHFLFAERGQVTPNNPKQARPPGEFLHLLNVTAAMLD